MEVLRAATLAGFPHGFLGRSGGVSKGVCAGLNVGFGSDDARDAVLENRRRAVAAVAPAPRSSPSTRSIRPTPSTPPRPGPTTPAPMPMRSSPTGRASRSASLPPIARRSCSPIAEAGVIGAAHAGWKGAFGGVIEATIAAMEAKGADRLDIVAALGPVIARKSYEVDEGFLRRFAEADPANERFFSPGREGHHQFDLEAYVLARLAAAGIAPGRGARPRHLCRARPLLQLPPRHPQRRADYGRQLSLIALPD